jgi:hypothetical protein
MKIEIRKLTDEGISEFQEYIDKARNGGPKKPPLHLINDLEKSCDSEFNIFIEDKKFSNRYDLGIYLWEKLKNVWNDDIRNDCGLWTWLALFYFEQLCPSKGPNRQEHYILSVGKWKIGLIPVDYRHSVLTPVWLIKDFKEVAPFFLCGTEKKPTGMDTMGDPIEQLFSRQYVMKNKKYLELIQMLYKDPKTGRVKTGAMSEPKKERLKSGKWSDVGKGGTRRLVKSVLPRLTLTFNVGEMKPEEILPLVGDEFENSKFHK